MCLLIAIIACFLLESLGAAVQPMCVTAQDVQRESEGQRGTQCHMGSQSPLHIVWKRAGEKALPKDGDEVDKKLGIGHSLAAFKFTSMRKEVLQKRLTEIFESSTPLPLVCVGLVLDYCRGWKKHAKIPAQMTYDQIIKAAFVVHNGKRVVVAQGNPYRGKKKRPLKSALNFWDLATGSLCAQIPDLEEGVIDVQATADGQRVLLCGSDSIIRVYDVNSLAQITQWGPFNSNEDTQIRFAVSPDDTLLAVIPSRHFVHIYDFKKNKLLTKLQLPYSDSTNSENDLCFSPNGQLLAALSGRYITIWDISTKEAVKKWRVSNSDYCIGFINDTSLMSCRLVWDISWPRKKPYATEYRTDASAKFFASSPERDCLAVSLEKGLVNSRSIVINGTTADDQMATIPFSDRTHHLSFSPDGQYIAAVHTWVRPGAISLLCNSYDVQE